MQSQQRSNLTRTQTSENSISGKALAGISAARKAEPPLSPRPVLFLSKAGHSHKAIQDAIVTTASSNTPEQGPQSSSNFAPGPAYGGMVYGNTSQRNRNGQHVDISIGNSACHHSRHNIQIPFILCKHNLANRDGTANNMMNAGGFRTA